MSGVYARSAELEREQSTPSRCKAGRAATLRKLDAAGLLADKRVACGSMALVKGIVVCGLGVGLLPRRVAMHGSAPDLCLVDRSFPSFVETISLIYRADLHKTHAAMRIKTLLMDSGRALGEAISPRRND